MQKSNTLNHPMTSRITPQAIFGHLGNVLLLLILTASNNTFADATPRVLGEWSYSVHPAWYPMNGAGRDCEKLAEGKWVDGGCQSPADPPPWSSDKVAAKALKYFEDSVPPPVGFARDTGWLKEGDSLPPYDPCGQSSGFMYGIEYVGFRALDVLFPDGSIGGMCGSRSRNIDCPVDTYPTESGDCQCPGACFEDETCPEGNPTLPAPGVKIHREDLIASNSLNSLPLSLSYRSRYSAVSSYELTDGAWRHNYQTAVYSRGIWWNGSHTVSSSATYVTRPNGAAYRFEQKDASSPWTSIETADALTQTASGWRLKRAEDDATETYNAQGKLLSIQQRNGLKTTLKYDTQGRLVRVTHPFGRTLRFSYDTEWHLVRIDTSGGEHFGLAYDANGNLTTLTYPDGRNRQFHYENSFYKNALTGVTDASGQRIGTYSYAADGRVFETQRANAVDHVRFAYAKNAQGLPQTVVTRYNAQGVPEQQTYNFAVQGHVTRPSALSVPTGQSGYVQNTVYDAKGLKTKHIQQDGRVTFYTRNAKGRTVREATYPASFQGATTPPALSQAERVSSTQWHSKWNLPLKTAEAYLITSYSYDGKGNLLELSETPTTDATGVKGFNAVPSGDTQITQWTYDTRNLPSTIVEQSAGVETGRWNISYDGGHCPCHKWDGGNTGSAGKWHKPSHVDYAAGQSCSESGHGDGDGDGEGVGLCKVIRRGYGGDGNAPLGYAGQGRRDNQNVLMGLAAKPCYPCPSLSCKNKPMRGFATEKSGRVR